MLIEAPPVVGAGSDTGTPPQPASVPTMARLKTEKSCWSRFMLLIFLEALGALLLLVLIVWWTMFSGRRKGELDHKREEQTTQPANERDQP
jgi:hypothetical protein